MGTRSKDRIKAMIAKDILEVYNRCKEIKKSINVSMEDTSDYLQALISQIPQSACGPLITKTPKVLRKKGMQRIETIPEGEVICETMSDSVAMHIKTEKEDPEDVRQSRVRRVASIKAEDNIKIQQSYTVSAKMRRGSNGEDAVITTTKGRKGSRVKRKISPVGSSDDDSSRGPTKHSKIEENVSRESLKNGRSDTVTQNQLSVEKNNHKRSLRHSNRNGSINKTIDANDKTVNIIDDTVIAPLTDDMEEPSMYEDAIGKPTPLPIMNSTMNINSTQVMQKMMNVTVILEPLKLNETVTIQKSSTQRTEKSSEKMSISQGNTPRSPRASTTASPSKNTLQDRMQQIKQAMANREFDDLLTDDESSPEEKRSKQIVKNHEKKKRQRRVTRSMLSSEDETFTKPAEPAQKHAKAGTAVQDNKNLYKPNALFSPYAKESVKRRVEAFEQAGLNSPKPTIDIDVPTRITRTKTRAIAAAKNAESEDTDKTVAQKLARKSLAKAKRISLAKQIKDVEESKENKVQTTQKISRLIPEKISQKIQQKTTPLGKTKIQMPSSVNRIQYTPSNNMINNQHTKALSAARANIITSVESFIQPPKSVKSNSVEKAEEKKRKLHDEDARRKREEALRLQTEEKRRKRQEKELKNKLAREAKEKQDMEKRQKAEKEREEKARLAQQMQEKQREELERKRLAQLQRAHEKEERRKLEEQQRLQRLQEQEEAERLLAEQKRREQDAEKRKEAELRAQQQAAAEAAKVKHQMAKYANNKNHGPTNYVLDSEPDEEDTDDESRPKHVVPHWAQSNVRKIQLAVQRYIPERAVFKFFDTRKCTPDLTEFFHGIDRSKLKRTSSAIWKSPPRYSMMED